MALLLDKAKSPAAVKRVLSDTLHAAMIASDDEARVRRRLDAARKELARLRKQYNGARTDSEKARIETQGKQCAHEVRILTDMVKELTELRYEKVQAWFDLVEEHRLRTMPAAYTPSTMFLLAADETE